MYINVLINLNRVFKCIYFCWCLSICVNGIYLDSVEFVKENCYLNIGKYVFWCFSDYWKEFLKKNRYWYIFDIKWVFLVFIVCKILVFFCKILFLCLFFVKLWIYFLFDKVGSFFFNWYFIFIIVLCFL